MKRHITVTARRRFATPEDLKCLRFGGCCEREERDVLLMTAPRNARSEQVFSVAVSRFLSCVSSLSFLKPCGLIRVLASGQHRTKILRRLTRLRRVSLINQHRVTTLR